MSGAASRPAQQRAQLFLGVVCGLVVILLGDAVLLPHVDRAPARAWGPAVVAGWLSVGWWVGTTRRWGRTRVLLAGASVGLAGCLVASLRPGLHAGLVDDVLAGGLPYHAVVVGWLCAAALPFAFPLGLLLAPALGGAGRGALARWLLGAATGAALAPWLAEVLMGHGDSLRAAALLAAAAAPLVGDGLAGRPRLPRGVAPALVALGAGAVIIHRLVVPITDLGTNTAAWWAGLACAGAAIGCRLPARPRVSPLDGLLALALPWTLAVAPPVRSLRAAPLDPEASPWMGSVLGSLGAHPSLIVDVLRLGLLALPFGLVLGRLLAARDETSRGGAWPLAWSPALLTVAGPLLLVVLVPRLSVPLLLALAALIVVVASALARPRPSPARWVASALLAGGIATLSVPDGPGGLRPERTWQLADGLASQVVDPDTGRPRMALDGRSPVGRHPLQARRLVHLPFLWQGGAGRALVVASDLGESEATALVHEPAHLDWLMPFPVPTVGALDGEVPGRRRQTAGERLFLLRGRDDVPYDLIVLMPDPRVRRRCGRLGTVEFFAEAAAVLSQQGLFCQWWDPAHIDVTDLKAVIASAASVFPSTYVVIDHPRSRRGLLGIIGRHLPLALDLGRMERTLAERPAVREELAGVGIAPLGVASLVIQHDGLLDLLAAFEDRLVDELPVLGSRGGRRELSQPHMLYTVMNSFGRRRCDPIAWIAATPETHGRLAAHTRDMITGWQHLMGAAQAVVLDLGAEAPAFEREAPGTGPALEGDAFLQALESLPDWRYLQDQVVGFAARLEDQELRAEAEQYLRRAVVRDEASPRLRFELASLVERKGDLDDARVLYGTVLAFDEEHTGATAALERLGKP